MRGGTLIECYHADSNEKDMLFQETTEPGRSAAARMDGSLSDPRAEGSFHLLLLWTSYWRGCPSRSRPFKSMEAVHFRPSSNGPASNAACACSCCLPVPQAQRARGTGAENACRAVSRGYPRLVSTSHPPSQSPGLGTHRQHRPSSPSSWLPCPSSVSHPKPIPFSGGKMSLIYWTSTIH